MEFCSNLLQQIEFNLKPKIEEYILILTDKTTLREHLSQPIQTHIKQFKTAVTSLTGYNGRFNVANKNNRFYSENHLLIKMVPSN